jgi:fibronectin type 3 domain-containing protein
LTVSAPTTSTATLTWNANTDTDLAGYNVYQATASGGYSTTPIATVPKTLTSYVASGLQVGTTCYFVITSFDTAGNESLHSNEVSKSIF